MTATPDEPAHGDHTAVPVVGHCKCSVENRRLQEYCARSKAHGKQQVQIIERGSKAYLAQATSAAAARDR